MEGADEFGNGSAGDLELDRAGSQVYLLDVLAYGTGHLRKGRDRSHPEASALEEWEKLLSSEPTN